MGLITLFGTIYESHYPIQLSFTFFFREFQPMAFAPNDSSLLLDQDTNQFLV